MNFKTVTASASVRSFFATCGIVLLSALALTGCARPNEENVKALLSETYQCKWLELDNYEKEESLPGIWSYVIRYKFSLNFRDGDAGAVRFMKGMVQTTPGVTNWQKVFENPKAHAYLREECSLQAQKILEQIVIQSYIQMDDRNVSAVEIPVSIPLNGWAEMTPGRGGWNMDMRRDKMAAEVVRSKPVPKTQLTSR